MYNTFIKITFIHSYNLHIYQKKKKKKNDPKLNINIIIILKTQTENKLKFCTSILQFWKNGKIEKREEQFPFKQHRERCKFPFPFPCSIITWKNIPNKEMSYLMLSKNGKELDESIQRDKTKDLFDSHP